MFQLSVVRAPYDVCPAILSLSQSLMRSRLSLVIPALLFAVSCSSGQQAAGPPPGPMPVTLRTAEPVPGDQSPEYVATLRARRSSELRPTEK